MYKVLIADDENKVCQLIVILIDWEALNMEIAGIASNGYEALEIVREKQPDIVITDIRMPGINGLALIKEIRKISDNLEFIIISGYREFKYAQTAIKYGVNEYLLKPVRKEELQNVLISILEKLQKKKEILSNEEQLRKKIEDKKLRLRNSFFFDILFRRSFERELLKLEKINEEYGYAFQEGCFQVVCMKLDRINKVYQGNSRILENKSETLLYQELQDFCYDMGVIYDNGVIISLLNFAAEKEALIKKKIKTLLQETILQDVMFQKLDVTIGLGTVAESIDKIWDSYKHAEYAYQQRILSGCNTVLEGSFTINSGFSESDIFSDFNKTFIFDVNNLNKEGILRNLHMLKKSLLERTETTGHEILQMTKEVCNLYLLCMRANGLTVSNEDKFLEDFNKYADDCNSILELFKHLSAAISSSMTEVIEDKKQEITKPIRIAKDYLEKNYMKSVTVEEVSLLAGFSVSHFSAMFKKETGATFLEYLSSVRMKHAKDLLKEGNMNIATICEAVGYSDVKYFTKIFRKYTGLKPNEFRKLYS